MELFDKKKNESEKPVLQCKRDVTETVENAVADTYLAEVEMLINQIMASKDERFLSVAVDRLIHLVQVSIAGGLDYGACEKAIDSINDQSLLEVIAIYASHPITQFMATVKLTDQTALASLAINSNEPNVRSAAVRHQLDQTLLEEIALNGNESNLVRSYAIKKLTSQSVLAEIAKKGGRFTSGDIGSGTDHFNIHLLAVRELIDKATLQDIAENTEDIHVRETAAKRLIDLKNSVATMSSSWVYNL